MGLLGRLALAAVRGAVLCPAVIAPLPSGAEESPRPNIVFVLVDDMRKDEAAPLTFKDDGPGWTSPMPR
jgi:hypothetical protein